MLMKEDLFITCIFGLLINISAYFTKGVKFMLLYFLLIFLNYIYLRFKTFRAEFIIYVIILILFSLLSKVTYEYSLSNIINKQTIPLKKRDDSTFFTHLHLHNLEDSYGLIYKIYPPLLITLNDDSAIINPGESITMPIFKEDAIKVKYYDKNNELKSQTINTDDLMKYKDGSVTYKLKESKMLKSGGVKGTKYIQDTDKFCKAIYVSRDDKGIPKKEEKYVIPSGDYINKCDYKTAEYKDNIFSIKCEDDKTYSNNQLCTSEYYFTNDGSIQKTPFNLSLTDDLDLENILDDTDNKVNIDFFVPIDGIQSIRFLMPNQYASGKIDSLYTFNKGIVNTTEKQCYYNGLQYNDPTNDYQGLTITVTGYDRFYSFEDLNLEEFKELSKNNYTYKEDKTNKIIKGTFKSKDFYLPAFSGAEATITFTNISKVASIVFT